MGSLVRIKRCDIMDFDANEPEKEYNEKIDKLVGDRLK